MIKVFIGALLLSLFACKKKEEEAPKTKVCYTCTGFPLSPDDSLDIGCYYTKQEAMDSVPIPEFRASEAEFDEHCKKK